LGIYGHHFVHDRNGLCALYSSILLLDFSDDCPEMMQLIAGSRQIFAFSRDQGLPFSKHLYQMNSRTHTPVHAVFFCAFLALVLGLISFAGPLAITAVFTMSVVCQYIGFVTPIIARFVGGSRFVHGPFNLGIMVSLARSRWLMFISD
jgi:amino acid transporter